jgi:hypothetical protein
MSARTLPRGVAPDVDVDEFPFIEMSDGALSAALRQWLAVMGTPWFGTPGTAGADALEARIKARRTWRAAWTLSSGPFDRASEAAYRPAHWNRLGEDGTLRHGYDLTRMYSTAAGVTEVCPGALHRGPREFDKSLAGWWRLEMSPWAWPNHLPDPAGYLNRRQHEGTARWVTTPTAKLLDDLTSQGMYGGFSVLDSYVGKGRPIFREWNQALEQLYREGGPEMRTAVKAAGRQTIGLLNSETYSTRRPDWHFSVIAQARGEPVPQDHEGVGR